MIKGWAGFLCWLLLIAGLLYGAGSVCLLIKQNNETFYQKEDSKRDRILEQLEAIDERLKRLEEAVSRVEEKWAFANPMETTASWYAKGLINPDGMGCASNVFPRGSVLKVQSLATGRIVVVKVLDYGPDPRIYGEGNIYGNEVRNVDLWRGAVVALNPDMLRLGTMRVVTARME